MEQTTEKQSNQTRQDRGIALLQSNINIKYKIQIPVTSYWHINYKYRYNEMYESSQENESSHPEPFQIDAEFNAQADQDEQLDVGRHFQIILLGLSTLYHLPFIIGNLYYSNQNTSCMETIVNGISFPLRIWLQVDAYTRVTHVACLLFATIGSYISDLMERKIMILMSIFTSIYGIFLFAWSLVGSVLYWGYLNSTGVCAKDVQFYMFAILIIAHVTICVFYLSPK